MRSIAHVAQDVMKTRLPARGDGLRRLEARTVEPIGTLKFRLDTMPLDLHNGRTGVVYLGAAWREYPLYMPPVSYASVT